MNKVLLGPGYFPLTDKGKPISNASIYVGIVDLDPTIPANQKQLSVQQEDGTIIDIAQPVSTSAGGVPEHNGSPVTLLVDGNHSLAVHDNQDNQIYYIPSVVGGGVPNEDGKISIGFYGNDLELAITSIGSIETTLLIDTTVTLAQDETIPDNITLEKTRGGLFELAGFTLTIDGGMTGDMLSQWFNGGGTVNGNPNVDAVYAEWFDTSGVDDTDAIVKALLLAPGGSALILPFSYRIATGNIQLPISKNIKIILGGLDITVATANPVFIINTGTSPDAIRQTIQGGRFVAEITGTGVGIRIVDSQHSGIEDCTFKGLDKGVSLEIDDFFSEANGFVGCRFRSCDFGVWVSITGASLNKSFASTYFSNTSITTAGANAAIAYGIFIDTDADIYRSEFDQLIIFPAKDGSIAFWCDGKMRNAHGSINIEGNDAGVTGNKGFYFGANADLIHVGIQADLKGAVAEFFKWDGAGTEMDGFMTRQSTEPPAHIRRQGVVSRIKSIVDSDLTTFHWKEHVTGSDRLQLQVNQNTPPEFVRIDDPASLAPVRIMPVGNESPGNFTEGDTTPSVKGKTYMKAINVGATSITDFDDGVAGQKITLQHTTVNTTLIHSALIRLQGSVNFTGAAHVMQTFLNDGSAWREISRVTP